jgi:uncharacterized membrane protein YphA (DoxX/SURF4 family)
MLGSFIAFKGLFYMFTIANPEMVPDASMDPLVDAMFFHIVIFFHLVGGIFIALGFKTRVMILAQLPILLGALFMFNTSSRLIIWEPKVELIISIGILVLLITYLIYGSGKWSIDAMRKQVHEE